MELTSRQRSTLTALVDEYQTTESPVSAGVIADVLDRSPGTLHNQMQTLKSLGLVEGVAGPRGGYEPTASAYEALGRTRVDDAETVTLARNYGRVSATVDRIDFTNVHHPERCRAQIHFQQSIRDLERGDLIAVGPSPVSSMVLAGEVVAIETGENVVIVDVARVEAPLRE